MQDKNSFIAEAIGVHGDKYDYSRVEYKNSQTKVDIICNKHGVFKQKPNKHVHGKQGCPYCRGLHRSSKDFIEKARSVHGDKYDYSRVEYKNATTKVVIVCPDHGEFEQSPHGHLKGYGCRQCSKYSRLGTDGFINKAKEVHGDRYDYSDVRYETNKDKIFITCPKHGTFVQLPSNHLYNNNGCPYCVDQVSLAQNEINKFIISNGFDTTINDRKLIFPFEIDILVNKTNLAVEYNGIYFHSYDSSESSKERNYHKYKYIRCKDKNIRLIQIFENEWLYEREVVKSILLNKLGVTGNRVYARKCSVIELSSSEFNNFCDSNHIQGSLNTKHRYGLLNDGRLLLVIGFNKHNKYDFVCTRLCTKIGYSVAGGASKLFKYFLLKMNPNSVLTYSDARYSDGNVYRNLGFVNMGHTKPNYSYVRGKKLFSRLNFQKHKLKSKLDVFDDSLTESENMFNNGYRRIWDAGNIRFVYYK